MQGDAKYDLRWEWPAGRQPDKTLLAAVDKIEKQGEGLFGIGRSPSIAENLPDAMVVSGKVIGDSVCVCIAKAPEGRDQEASRGWLKSWDCVTP